MQLHRLCGLLLVAGVRGEPLPRHGSSSGLLAVIKDDVYHQGWSSDGSFLVEKAVVHTAKDPRGRHTSEAWGHVSMGWRVLPLVMLGLIAVMRITRYSRSGGKMTSSISSLDWPRALLACVLYFLTGPALIILNKYIMTTLAFPYPIAVTNLGLVSMFMATQVLVRGGAWQLTQTTLDQHTYLRMVLPVAVFSSLSFILGNWAYIYLSVPLIQILKSFTVVYVMALGFFFGLEQFSAQLVVAVFAIVLGLALSICHDVSVTQQSLSVAFIFGLGVMTSANFAEAARSIYTQLSVDRMAFFDSMYWCMPSMVIFNSILVCIFELRSLRHEHFSGTLIACLLASSVLGGMTNFANFWLTKLVGSLSMKVLVNARNILLVLFSVVAFGEPCTAMQYLGYSIALGGLAIYDDTKRSAGSSPAEYEKLQPNKAEVARLQAIRI